MSACHPGSVEDKIATMLSLRTARPMRRIMMALADTRSSRAAWSGARFAISSNHDSAPRSAARRQGDASRACGTDLSGALANAVT